jgi:hypothetical protein
MDKEESFCNSTCEDQINMAERELSAFIRAVTELFGPEQAKRSTQDWFDEFDLIDCPPRSTDRDWRAVTVAASARLANRLTVAQASHIRLPGCCKDLSVFHARSSRRSGRDGVALREPAT